MPAVWKEKGSCPVCGCDVARLLTMFRGRMREVYTCPDHGTVSYGVQAETVRTWNDFLSEHSSVKAPEGPRLAGIDQVG